MAQQNRQYVTIDSIVNDYIEQSEQSAHKYFKLWQLAFRGMERLGINFFYQIRSVKLPLNPNKTVTLPNDFINYTKIGVLNSAGEIAILKYNPKQTFLGDQMPNREQMVVDDSVQTYSEWNANFFFNYWNGTSYTNQYGFPSGGVDIGSFNIDNTNGVILLNQHFNYDYLMVEYISSPNPDEDYQVPVQFREALVAWLGWQEIMYMPNTRKGALGDKRDRRNNFFNERRLAIAEYSPFRLEDAYELSQTATRLVPKA
ncbi:MAG: hypothetical protein K8R85_01520 [Bacteroidetes bacterium]|nr:hypothetical protein [Bacteroidota bacterium]